MPSIVRIAKEAIRAGSEKFIPPRLQESLVFRHHIGHWPNLRAPSSFNEKVTYRKLYDRNHLFPVLGDKLAVRSFVKDRIGSQYLPELYGVFDSASDLDFAALPRRFVLKATHTSGSILFVEDSKATSLSAAQKQFEAALSKDYGDWKHEWWYAQVPRRIIAEEYLAPPGGPPPPDYKLFVFDGTVRMIQVDRDRFKGLKRTLLTPDWQLIEGTIKYPQGPYLDPPSNLDEMIQVAASLGRGIDFVRVDLYSLTSERVVFGEMTTAPASGRSKFYPKSLDDWLGSFWP